MYMTSNLEKLKELTGGPDNTPRTTSLSPEDGKDLDTQIQALHGEIGTFARLVKRVYPDGIIPLQNVDWNTAKLPADAVTFLQSEYSFQPEDVTLSLQVTDHGELDHGVLLVINRGGSEWSHINLNTWNNSSYGINVGATSTNREARVHAAQDAEIRLNSQLYDEQQVLKYSKRLEAGKQVFDFAVTETVHTLEAKRDNDHHHFIHS